MTAYRYKAFISYSHADKKAVEWLFRRVETYRTPKALIGSVGHWGGVPARLQPVFRDREELSTTHALGEALTEALETSEFLIVICSPASARSRWVNEEIRSFRGFHGPDKVLAVIVDGEPGAPVGEGKDGCFPAALLAPTVEGGPPEEPIAADLRGEGDGRRFGFLKLAAGLLGVRLDDLIHREARRRGRDQAMVTAIASSVAFVTSGLAYFAAIQADEAQKQRAIAVTERDMATSALDYLVGIFRIANPATENPKTITALTVLDRGRQRIESSFGDKPAVQGKLLGAIGEIYANLGEIDMARKTLKAAIEKPGGAIEDRLNAELRLAEVLTKAVQLDEAKDILNQVDREIADKVGVVDDLNSVRGRIAERRAEIAIYGARDDEAVKFFEEAKRHFSAASSDDARLFVARASSSRGLILSRMKRFDEAREDLEFARSVQLELHGAGHLETAAATQNLAYMNFEAGENEKAAKLLNEAISTYRRVIEPTHPVYSQAILLLGRIYEAQGDFAAAVKAHRESVKTAQSVYGANNENVGYRLLYLALAEAKAGDAADGLASLDAAQEIYDLKFPAGDFNHGDIRVYRAMVLDKAGRPEEAKRLCAEGLDMLKANLPANDVYLGEMTGHCAAISG